MRRLLAVLGTIMIGTIFLATGQHAAATNVSFTAMWIGNITPGTGHLGVDLSWPGTDPVNHTATMYNPCHEYANTSGTITFNDPYYGACVESDSMRTSYYAEHTYSNGTTDFPYGIFVNNQDINHCTHAVWCPNPSATTINHGWANLMTDMAIEIYPHYTDGTYDPLHNTIGGVRIGTNSFPTFANGGRYSPQIGNVVLPQTGQTGVGKLNGFVRDNGAAVGADIFAYDMFQQDSTKTTSTGFPMTGFASDTTNSDGYYSSGPVPYGTYTIFITDTRADINNHTPRAKYKITGVGVHGNGERLDFDLSLPCFGYTGNCMAQ